MNLFTSFILIVIFLLLFNSDTVAQPRLVEIEELNKAVLNDASLRNRKNVRVTTVHELIVFQRPIITKKETIESVGVGPRRILTEWEENSKKRTREVIIVDSASYTKEDNGDWESLQMQPLTISNITTGSKSIQCDLHQIVKHEVALDGKPTVLFIETLVNRGDEGIQKKEVKKWFDLSGLLLKSEETNETFLYRFESKRVTSDYEYDVDLKIEPPIK